MLIFQIGLDVADPGALAPAEMKRGNSSDHRGRGGRCRPLIAGTVFVSGMVGACRLDVTVDCGYRDESKRVVADPANGGWEAPGSFGDAPRHAERGSGGAEQWFGGYDHSVASATVSAVLGSDAYSNGSGLVHELVLVASGEKGGCWRPGGCATRGCNVRCGCSGPTVPYAARSLVLSPLSAGVVLAAVRVVLREARVVVSVTARGPVEDVYRASFPLRASAPGEATQRLGGRQTTLVVRRRARWTRHRAGGVTPIVVDVKPGNP